MYLVKDLFLTLICFLPLTIYAQSENIIIKHRTSGEINYSPWGVQFNPVAPHVDIEIEKVHNSQIYSLIDSLLNALDGTGSKWVRFSINWSTIQDDAGKFHWKYTDKVVNGINKKGINIILCLNGGHKRFTRDISVRGPGEMKAWLNFTDSVSRRYSKQVKYYEIWNEPNTIWFWLPGPVAAEYFELVKQSSILLRRNVSDVKIIGGSLARLDFLFADTLAQLGIEKYIDIFSIHPYGEFPEAIFKPVRVPVRTPIQYIEADHSIFSLKELFKGTPVKIWQDECGYASASNSLGWTGNGPWGDTIQAKWLLRRMLTDMIVGSDISCYFSLYEFREGNPDKYNSKGLLKLESLIRKPAYYTFRNMASIFSDSVFVEQAPLVRITEKKKEGIFANFNQADLMGCYLKCSSGKCFAYWLPWRMQEIIKPAIISLQINKLIDPVMVDMIKGKVYPVKTRISENGLQEITDIPLTDYPVFIMEKELLNAY
jgi:hypothetical protein